MEEDVVKNDGYLEVADFCTVVSYDKSFYPNGVKKFKTKVAEAVTEKEPVTA
jgi:hypothetical protein